MTLWHQARAKQRRGSAWDGTLHAPVGGLCRTGEKVSLQACDAVRPLIVAPNGERAHRTCKVCGYHKCSCAPLQAPTIPVTAPGGGVIYGVDLGYEQPKVADHTAR